MANKIEVLETFIIISVGMSMHLFRLSIIELHYTKMPQLMPNAASSLFVFSILCIFSKLRPLWPQTLRMPQKFLIFLVELALILCATDFLLRQIWLPTLKLLNFLSNFLGQYVLVANQSFLLYNAPEFSNWIRNDFFYIARFLLAVLTFIFMLDITGITKLLQTKVHNVGGGVSNVMHLPSSSESRSISTCSWDDLGIPDNIDPFKQAPFDVYDLPCVPQADILNMANRVSAKNRKQSSARKNIRKSKVSLNEEYNECNC